MMNKEDPSGDKLAQEQSHLKQQKVKQRSVLSNIAIANLNIEGFSNFDSDSLDGCSEFDTESVTLDYYKESSQRPSPSKMAPTTTIETITITRPLKVIAFICGVIVVILMIMALASTDWLMAAGWRQGLFIHCIEEDVESPLPFNLHDPPGCYASRDVAYIKATATLCIITLVTDIIATILTGLGLRTQNHNVKYKFYRIAVLVMLLSLLAVLSALIIYPVCFAGELNLANRPIWEFGWAYGVGWGAAIFLFGAVVLLLCDKESEEIYYKERKIVHENQMRA
ncbi:transmembrane protein 47 isoform X1 [Ceratitis capitata]|uniref:Transmembrane protein 47 n=2 Tax=Ceratitis capitata TaxID=7213 RepID=W8BLR1_CERCA|nr:transmembrane protein 47 isoform X1 [Ceratitis capitata]XP_004537232.1 transmembrane protein 47 isoform X1 [Ceratitis capitata]XP_012162109.1 transmembrane protein 47 isoform X1 [Ceratitis capitata]XP_012162110.1 transmembrane protein 47 isoform X1 [Ceratitis capitata]